MSVLDKLASALGHRDEKPNVELAQKLAEKNDVKGVAELASALTHKDKAIANDAVKTLYEIGALKPELIAPYTKQLIDLLQSKNNRMQWGAMTALGTVASLEPALLYKSLGTLADIADKGSVITRDHYIKILVQLAQVKKYKEDATGLLLAQLQAAPENQFPSYAESAASIIDATNKAQLINIINDRLPNIEVESKRKRVEKLVKKLNK